MKIVQEENLQHVEHQLEQRYQLEPMSCLFFALGMLLSAYGLHYFVFWVLLIRKPLCRLTDFYKKPS